MVRTYRQSRHQWPVFSVFREAENTQMDTYSLCLWVCWWHWTGGGHSPENLLLAFCGSSCGSTHWWLWSLPFQCIWQGKNECKRKQIRKTGKGIDDIMKRSLQLWHYATNETLRMGFRKVKTSLCSRKLSRTLTHVINKSTDQKTILVFCIFLNHFSLTAREQCTTCWRCRPSDCVMRPISRF